MLPAPETVSLIVEAAAGTGETTEPVGRIVTISLPSCTAGASAALGVQRSFLLKAY
jgi:hypothetical protein